MNKISILDCTLRDGGYINNWHFKRNAIQRIVDYLEEAHIDIIECGFLQECSYNENVALFSDVNQIKPFITPKRPNTMYVAMLALGDIEPEKIAPYDGESIDGIRITFHKHEWNACKEVVQDLCAKGYKVFVQPVGTIAYSDLELIRLVQEVNTLSPFAFYIVDTLGTMYQKDLLHLFNLIDNNLSPDIQIGFHSHNNLQLSFANAQELLRMKTRRNIIIDSSVFGMGRGAGNLATELVTQYINDNLEYRFQVTPLLSIVDQFLGSIYNKTPWGYSAPYYLAAVGGCHPNYATYLMNKQTLNVEEISKILNQIPNEERSLYNENLIERLYLEYQRYQIDDSEAYKRIAKIIEGRNILLVAPGQSIITYKESIQEYIQTNNPLIISVNFVTDLYPQDLVFISNKKRSVQLLDSISGYKNMIVTSNLYSQMPKDCLFVNYSNLIGEGREADNAGAMLISLLYKVGIKSVTLAGFDGFNTHNYENYYSEDMNSVIDRQALLEKNEGIRRQLLHLSKKVSIKFLTPSLYNLTCE